ncbi:DUF4344 domain-containing metallopeptidase [Dongshaea marina]|uniref:DUF4344 domain-containing metallopeptidase n=1 Tax=Dongshaea marina TaxID=2047966 RepID=UPI00131F151B|nr:DUF4344 domain-containing metallopeptidase [Dongshaea marina]
MKQLALLGILLTTLLSSPTRGAEAELFIEFLPAKDRQEQLIRQQLEGAEAIRQFRALVDETFKLSEPLTISFGATDGPLYDPETNQIEIPYAFILEVTERFEGIGEKQLGIPVSEATQDVLMHTLFHELGHALISAYQLPVVGREEDAVDGLATWMLINEFEQGSEIAISAAQLFELESEDSDEIDDVQLQGEHSLDLQRFFQTLCHVVGHDPSHYQEMAQQAGLSRERVESCIDEYQQLDDSWMTLLAPHLK